jgi:glycosyltransferase involved in cell wall biosynthesis
MDVLIIGDYDPSGKLKGGSYTHMKSWVEYLLKNTSYQFGIFSGRIFYERNNNKLTRKQEYPPLKKIKSTLLTNIFHLQKIYKELLERTRPKVLHFHSTNTLSNKNLELVRKMNIKMILSVHGIVTEERKYWPRIKKIINGQIYGYREKKSLKKTNWIIVDTGYVQQSLNNQYSINNSKLSVIPLGIDDYWYQIKRHPKSNRLLTVGGIEHRKGYEYLIEACSLLKQEKVKFNLNICGRVRNKDYFEQLAKKIDQKDLDNQIHFKLDLSDKVLIEEYKNADIFVLPSLEESQGIVLVEAMAVGLPIVATNTGGIPYIVKNNKNGLLFEKRNSFQLKKALKRLLTNSSMKDKMTKINLQNAKIFTAENTNIQILNIYNKFLS